MGVLAFLAFMAVAAAKRQQKMARGWQDRSLELAEDKVANSIHTAKAAETQAKKHDAKANEIKAKAESRISQIAEKDDEISDILDRWRAN